MYNDRRSQGVFALPKANLTTATCYDAKIVDAYFFPRDDTEAASVGDSKVKHRAMTPESALMVVIQDGWQKFGVPISCPHAIAGFMIDTNFVGDPAVVNGRPASAYRAPSRDLIAIRIPKRPKKF